MRAVYLISILIALAITAGAILYYNSIREIAVVPTPTPKLEQESPAKAELGTNIDLLYGSVSKNFSE